MRMDAEIKLLAVKHLRDIYAAARLRLACSPKYCEACGSYEVASGVCRDKRHSRAGPPVGVSGRDATFP